MTSGKPLAQEPSSRGGRPGEDHLRVPFRLVRRAGGPDAERKRAGRDWTERNRREEVLRLAPETAEGGPPCSVDRVDRRRLETATGRSDNRAAGRTAEDLIVDPQERQRGQDQLDRSWNATRRDRDQSQCANAGGEVVCVRP